MIEQYISGASHVGFFFSRKYILNVLFIEQEADSQFRYIALELCLATVQDLITGKTQYTYKMDAIDILFQAMSGISYLHSLDIGKQTLSNFWYVHEIKCFKVSHWSGRRSFKSSSVLFVGLSLAVLSISNIPVNILYASIQCMC